MIRGATSPKLRHSVFNSRDVEKSMKTCTHISGSFYGDAAIMPVCRAYAVKKKRSFSDWNNGAMYMLRRSFPLRFFSARSFPRWYFPP